MEEAGGKVLDVIGHALAGRKHDQRHVTAGLLIKFAEMFHGNDERVPVAGLAWGVEVLDAVVREICT